MALLEHAKKVVERVTGYTRPSARELSTLVRRRKANPFRFKDDGTIPNNPKWPFVLYRGPVRLPALLDPAAVFEDLFESNGWAQSWRDGI